MIQHIDRAPTKPNRYAVYDDGHNFLRYEYHERADEPTQEGNPINKALQDEFLAASGTTTGTGEAFLLAQAGFYLRDGAVIRLKLHSLPIGAATLNVESTGAHPIVTPKGKPIPGYSAGTWVTVIYNATAGNFILQGEGGSAARYGKEPKQLSSFEALSKGLKNPNFHNL